jgi:glycosyltransferase involved in cell wall biosynthesis
MGEPLVSVVTPVFNGARFLQRCIESVRRQTYGHWDYTIIDNRSTDATSDIAGEYAARDPRIRVLSNAAFVDVVANYNMAVRAISPDSTYCKVIAADDWMFPDCLERMVGLAEAHPSVAIVGAYGLIGPRVAWTGLAYADTPGLDPDPCDPCPSAVIPGREACRLTLLRLGDFFGTPSSVLYRSSVVRSQATFYNESNLRADIEACLEVLEHHDFGFVYQILTASRPWEEGSVSYSRSRPLNVYSPGILADLVTYGPRYLEDRELKRRIREHLGEYYRYLASQMLRGRDREFWRFHRRELSRLGYPLRTHRLVGSAAWWATDHLLNPKRTAERIGGWLRRAGRSR